jgi:uncharacterized membrane protein YfcA
MAPDIRAGIIRAGAVAGGSALAALAVGRIPAPGLVRALGMLALPCVLFAVLRREDRRMAHAADRARNLRPRVPAPPARPRP